MSIFTKAISSILLTRDILRKGEGTYTVDPETGELIFLGGLHPDQFHENNPLHDDGFDLPKNAHYGNRAAEGAWLQGQHGEHVFIDKYEQEHRHGIDAVISKVGNILYNLNKDPSKARDLVQKSIANFNKEHVDSGKQGLPDINSPEWRKLTFGDYQNAMSKEESNNFTTRGAKGTLITSNLSSKPSTKFAGFTLGRHPESYKIPFAPYLREILEPLGYSPREIDGKNKAYDEGITHGYISGKDISSNTQRLRGSHGQNLTQDGTLPPEFRDRLGHGSSNNQLVHSNVHTWETIHNMPHGLFHEFNKDQGGRPLQTTSYGNYILGMSTNIINNTPPEILDQPLMVNNNKNITLRSALEDKSDLTFLMTQMGKSPAALTYLLGNPAQTGVAAQVVTEIRDTLINHLGEAGAKKLQNASHSTSAGSTPALYAKGKHGHQLASEMMALSGLVGDPAILGEYESANFPKSQHTEMQKKLYTAVAAGITAGHGGELRNHAPISGEERTDLKVRHLDDHMDAGREMPLHMQEKVVPSPLTQIYDAGPTEDYTLASNDVNAIAPAPNNQSFNPTDKQRDAYTQFASRNPEDFGKPLYEANTGNKVPVNLSDDDKKRWDERISQHASALSPFQTKITDFVQTSFDTISIEDRLVKAMERVQMLEAQKDSLIIKHIPRQSLDINKEDDVSFLAMKLGITKQDIKVISNSKGDWYRIAKAYQINPSVVKIVKVTLGGV